MIPVSVHHVPKCKMKQIKNQQSTSIYTKLYKIWYTNYCNFIQLCITSIKMKIRSGYKVSFYDSARFRHNVLF